MYVCTREIPKNNVSIHLHSYSYQCCHLQHDFFGSIVFKLFATDIKKIKHVLRRIGLLFATFFNFYPTPMWLTKYCFKVRPMPRRLLILHMSVFFSWAYHDSWLLTMLFLTTKNHTGYTYTHIFKSSPVSPFYKNRTFTIRVTVQFRRYTQMFFDVQLCSNE